MLVQVSPWESAETSIRRAETAAKRRRRSSSDASLNGSSSETTTVVASFVAASSRRAVKKKSAQNTDGVPVLVLTSGHRISVIARSKDGSYHESSVLQYSSRPGDASSFFPTTVKNGSSTSELPSIPAVLEYKNDKVYALQNGNKRLCCWNIFTDGGPDEKGALKIDLRHPAVSLSLLGAQRGIVYGSCMDGSLFIARIVKDSTKAGGEVLSVEYVAGKTVKGAKHVGTVSQIQDDGGKTQSTGRKRKNSDVNIGTSVMVYQAFHADKGVTLIRHHLMIHQDPQAGIQTNQLQHSTKDVIIDLNLSREETIGRMSFSSTTSGSQDKLPLQYSVDKVKGSNGTRTGGKLFFAVIDLSSGTLARQPAPLPESTNSIVCITPDVVAATIHKEIILMDLESGATLGRIDLPATVTESSFSWQLYAESKSSTIAVIESTGAGIQSHFSKIQLDGNVPAESSAAKLKSSLKLAAALAAEDSSQATEHFHVTKSLLPDQGTDEIIQASLDSLSNFRSQALSKTGSKKSHFFLKSYEKTVDSMLKGIRKVEESHKEADRQTIVSKKTRRSILSGKKEKQMENVDPMKTILHRRRLSRMNGSMLLAAKESSNGSFLPSAFVEGATLIANEIIQQREADSSLSSSMISAVKSDAIAVLRQLLLTGKLNATVFPSNLGSFLGIIDTLDTNDSSIYSSFDFSLDLLKYCTKVSEKQMVALLLNVLRKSKANRIAQSLRDDRTESVDIKKLAKSFCDSKSKSKDTVTANGLSSKLILAGITSILRRVITLSECNESMLRDALLGTVMRPEEASILAISLSNLLASSQKYNLKKKGGGVNTTKVICQWVSALCAGFSEELSEAKISEDSVLTSLLRTVSSGISYSEAVLNLQEDLSRIQSAKVRPLDASEEEEIIDVLDEPRRSDREIPGYSIETLIF